MPSIGVIGMINSMARTGRDRRLTDARRTWSTGRERNVSAVLTAFVIGYPCGTAKNIAGTPRF